MSPDWSASVYVLISEPIVRDLRLLGNKTISYKIFYARSCQFLRFLFLLYFLYVDGSEGGGGGVEGYTVGSGSFQRCLEEEL